MKEMDEIFHETMRFLEVQTLKVKEVLQKLALKSKSVAEEIVSNKLAVPRSLVTMLADSLISVACQEPVDEDTAEESD